LAQGEHPNQGTTAMPTPVAMGAQKKKVIILAMGSSRADFDVLRLMEDRPEPLRDADIWGINYMGAVTRLDRVIHIDPVHPYLGHAAVKDMCDFALNDGIPFYTSHAHPFYMNHVVYPFDKVVAAIGTHYLNGSVAYAVALAIAEGYTDIGLFGADFSYPNAHVSESGRACVEYLMGIGTARGIRFIVAQSSTLMDAMIRQQPYGWFRNPLVPPSAGGSLMSVQEIIAHVERSRQPKVPGTVAFHVVPPPAELPVIPAEHKFAVGSDVTSFSNVSVLTSKPNGAIHEAGYV
jgi:hypothetical protein